MLLYEHTNKFNKLDNIIEFVNKLKLMKDTGKTNFEINGEPILPIVAELDDIDLVKSLLELGVNINAARTSKYAKGNTALIEASRYGYYDIVRLLIENGADVQKTNYMGFSALTFAVINRHPEVVTYLLEHGANVDVIDKNNDTPLLLAVAKGYFEIVEILLKYGACVSHVDNDGDDALSLAQKNGYLTILKTLKNYVEKKA